MLRCSKEAFSQCPTSHLCESLAEATFAEGSECDKFNQKVEKCLPQVIPLAEGMQLLDANGLVSTLAMVAKKFAESDVQKALMGRVMYIIEHKPAVDAVEVVRCKDCKHFVAPQGVSVCDCFYGLGFPNANGNDFCSYGERKDNG